MSNFLLTAGIILLTLGAIAYFAEQSPGKDGEPRQANLTLLPGDIKYESENGNFKFYFPIATSIVLSIVLSLLMRLFS